MEQNFLLLIKAFKKILFKYPNYQLILLGEGEQRKLLTEEIIKLELKNKIFLMGYKEKFVVQRYMSYSEDISELIVEELDLIN